MLTYHSATTYEAVEQLAFRVKQSAVRTSSGQVAWIQPETLHTERPRPVQPHIYNGSTGIALFLAALYKSTGQLDWKVLALESIAPLRQHLVELAEDSSRTSQLQLALGGWVGLGSFLYGFVRIGLDCEAEDLLKDSVDLLKLLTPERIAADRQLDLMAGCAGAMLATLAIYRQTLAPQALDVSCLCGERLLDARVSWKGSPKAWPGIDRPPLTGFAHGAAGVSYALMQLYATTQDVRYLEAALEGFAFERSLFDFDARNWLDPRTGGLVEQSAWCHGAPGIALSRAVTLEIYEDQDLHSDLEIALSITQNVPEYSFDHLCCGNAGQIEILAFLGRQLGKPELVERARVLAGRVTEFAGRRLDFRLRSSDLSLFHGLAGVGWSLMSLEAETTLPSPLILESDLCGKHERGISNARLENPNGC